LPTKTQIITKLSEALHPLSYIHALWLEGADATGKADEYSDIDFWLDFDDAFETEAIEAVETTLSELATIDYKHIMNHPHPQIRQRIYHLENTSKYLMIDFCWQLHSRECTFIENDPIEPLKIIFDKSGVIRYKPQNPSDYATWNAQRLAEAKYRRTQHPRAEKYVHRGQYLEAYAYYNRYVLEPVIDLLRLIHTPAHADYGLVHISQHIPASDRQKLEKLAQISSLEDIATNIPKAAQWFDRLVATV